ncbi:hypothetical protein CLOM_g15080 [Closterium sp. NIES-68]|nr:hypothetical protein CLOM_g15080 [Closterium sp. NIES-68]GJP72721.1 hypothetical protein CLOP_g3478 [Closterium sp. NIES-67]
MRAVFAALDADGDGVISADDLRAYSAQRGLPAGYALEFVSRAQRGRRGAEDHLRGEWPLPGTGFPQQVLRNSLSGDGWNGAGCAAGGLQAGGAAGAGIGGRHIGGRGEEGVVLGGKGGPILVPCRASAGFAASSSQALPAVDLSALLSSAAQQLQRGLDSARFHLGALSDRSSSGGGVGSSSSSSSRPSFGVSYAAFEEFVDAKDRALWNSFRCLDSNGDGWVSQADLERSMRDLASRCSHTPVATAPVAIAKGTPPNSAASTASTAGTSTPASSRLSAGLGQPCTADFVGRACSRKMVRALQQQQQQQQQEGEGETRRVQLVESAEQRQRQACRGAARDPLSPAVSFEEFRNYFTLLPASDHLFDYWISASCPLACHVPAAPDALAGPAGRTSLGSVGAMAAAATGLATTGAGVATRKRASRRGVPRSRRSSSSGSSGGGGSSSSGNSSGSGSKRVGVWRHLVAGGMAGATSRTVTAPLETLRLRMMVTSDHGLLQTCSQVWSEAGWRAFFRGNMVNVVRSAPQKAIDFFAFEAFKQAIATVFPTGPASLQVVASGALAGATSTLVLYPLDVVRSRLTVAARSQYTGIGNALTTIVKQEGVPALYRGLGASLLSILPEAAITYGCFDLLKSAVQQSTGRTVGVLPALACGVASAFTGQLVAYPLELVARRLQVSAAAAGAAGAAKQNLVTVTKAIVAERGVAGLYQGIVPASLKVIPMAIVSFGVYESVKFALVHLAEQEERRQGERERRREEEEERRRVVEEALEEERGGRRVYLPVCKSCREEVPLCGRQRGSVLLVG